MRRLMDEENKKLRRAEAKEFNDTAGGVVRSTPSFTPHTFDPLEPFIGP